MSRRGKEVVVAALVVGFVVAGYAYFRAAFGYHKRLRAVEPGRLYRSGQMTAAGFTDAVRRLHLRTIVNVQDDFPDPDLPLDFLDRTTIKESELCRRLGVQYVWLPPDLKSRRTPGGPRPQAIDDFLALMDNPQSCPVLLHCKAGLHRTGVLSAVYRIEYQGWSRAAAFRELRALGFGNWVCTRANDYVDQYVLSYRPRPARDVVAQRRAD
jgi:protein tyrosine phosphatase (PTP) superfamily phosphohydrolase (DUF442 family)